jgi:subfamily B ATP-binding cassette protein MsbA
MISDLNTPPPGLFVRMKRLWPYFNKPYSAWIAAIASTIVVSLTEPLVPALLQPLLDHGFKKDGLELWTVPATIILLFSIRGSCVFLGQLALAKVANEGLLNIRERMFEKLLTAQLPLFKQQTSSALANTLVYEVQMGSVMLVNSLISLARDSLTLLALLGYLLYLNWKLTLIVAFLFPTVAFVMKTLSRRLFRLTRASQQATDELAYVVEENVLAHRDVRLQAAQKQQAERFHLLGDQLRRLTMKSIAASSAMTPLTQILAAFALSAVISVAIVQSTDNTTSVGSFVAFVTATLMLIAPIKHLSEIATPITRGLAAMERGLDLMETTPDETSGSFSKDRAVGDIHFEDVSVQYPEAATPAISNINLSIQHGETIALVGASGSGKTTLVNLLPRFAPLTKGKIFLDGHDLQDWDLTSLRSQLALVSQHVLMLNDTITANVALGQSIDRDRVVHCLKAANLQALIDDLPEGIDTIVGHNAMQLSGGQRQRLAIARALYKDAPVLILDEATSALDTESERMVQDALQRLMQKRTTLVIAHRLSTIQHADRIVVLDSGKVVETGTHAELLKNEGAYALLYRMGFPSDTPHD